MNTTTCCTTPQAVARGTFRLAFAGNPNSGKTTLFNALTGLRAQTANYPGTTVERRIGHCDNIEVIDFPGLYDLEALSEEERIAAAVLTVRRRNRQARRGDHRRRCVEPQSEPVSHQPDHGAEVPVILALNMMDLAEEVGLKIDAGKLARELGCPVIPIVARSGRGITELRAAIQTRAVPVTAPVPTCNGCSDCRFKTRYAWTDAIAGRGRRTRPRISHPWTQRLDRVLTHPIVGVLAFLAVMLGVFFLIFQIAHYPDGHDRWIVHARGSLDRPPLPPRDLRPSSSRRDWRDGRDAGVSAADLHFVFHPVAARGYRLSGAGGERDGPLDAARRVPGNASVPLLSAHACAIPAIMATRVIEDERDRLLTIMVLPLITVLGADPGVQHVGGAVVRAQCVSRRRWCLPAPICWGCWRRWWRLLL